MMTKIFIITFVLFCCCPLSFYAQDTSQIEKKEQPVLYQLSLDDILNSQVAIASKNKQRISEAPSIVSVVTAQDIENMGAISLEEVLRVVAGFDITQALTFYGSKVAVRGLRNTSDGNARVKIMMNGYALHNTNTGGPWKYINHIPLENIQRIEVIRGPGSALYGTNAFLGVINIITKDGTSPSKVAFNGGSFHTWRPSVQWGLHKKDLKIYAYADYFHTDGPRETVDTDLAATYASQGLTHVSSTPDKTTYNAEGNSFQTQISYKSLSVDAFFINQNNQSPIGLYHSLTDDDDDHTTAYFIGVNYALPFAQNKGTLNAKGFFQHHGNEAQYETYQEGSFGLPEDTQLFQRLSYKSNYVGGEVGVNYEMTEGIQLVAGGMIKQEEQFEVTHHANYNFTPFDLVVDGTAYAPNTLFGSMLDISEEIVWNSEGDRIISAGYTQLTLDLKDLLNLALNSFAFTVGGRYDNYSDVGSSLNPRVSLVFSPSENLFFKALYGQAFRVPVFGEQIGSNSNELEPETISTYEGLVGFKVNNFLQASVAYFNSHVEDGIVKLAPNPDFRIFDNAGKFVTQGVEFELKMAMSDQEKKLQNYAFLNATYQSVKDATQQTIVVNGNSYIQEEFNPGYVPSFIINVGIHTIITRNISLNVHTNYINERVRSEEKTLTPEGEIVEVDSRESIPSRALLNGNLILHHFNFAKGLKVQLSGYNLLNTDHRDPDDLAQVLNDLPRAGINFRVNVGYVF